MDVDRILRSKGAKVITIRSDATVAELVRGLRDAGIGAMVVSDDGWHVDGIVSERDVVRGLAERGVGIMDERISGVMTRVVATCSPHDTVKQVMSVMTLRHVRHLPVVEDGVLRGIVSIGDVVKFRLDEIQTEAGVLRDAYIGRT
jgi:CBS domain-containing protein